MARKRKSTRRGAARRNTSRAVVVRHNAPVRRRRRHHSGFARRNPPAMLRNIVPFAIEAGIGAVRTTGGKVAVRTIRGLTKQDAGSVVGSAVEAVAAIVGGALISTFHRGAGRDFAVGGLQAPLETTVQRMKIPRVSDALGDDGFYLGDEYNLAGSPEYVGGYSPNELVAGEDPVYGLGASSTGERYSVG